MRTRVRKFAKEGLIVRLTPAQSMEAKLLMRKVDLTAHQAMQPMLSDAEGPSEQIDLATLIAPTQKDHGASQGSA